MIVLSIVWKEWVLGPNRAQLIQGIEKVKQAKKIKKEKEQGGGKRGENKRV